MATVQHYISVLDPSTTEMNLGAGGGSGQSNIHDGTSSTSTDLVEIRWTQTTSGSGTVSPTVSRKMLFDAMDLIKRFVLQHGFGPPGTDGNIPV